MAGTARGRFRRAWKGDMPMVSLKLMAGAARSMVVKSARTTAAEIAARWGSGGFPIQIGGGFLYNTYPNVSCMYLACILKDTCIPNVS
jgi:hypothetical protein